MNDRNDNGRGYGRQDGSSRGLAYQHDYDRDRAGYAHGASPDRGDTRRVDTHDRSRSQSNDFRGNEQSGRDYSDRAFRSPYDAGREAGWQGRSPSYDPTGSRDGMSTRDYASGYEPRGSYETDDRDGWQRQSARGSWDGGPHARALGESGFGPQYRGREGQGASTARPSTGKAPKGYVRSDERIKEEICERLASQSHDWSEVEVHVSDGEVTLTGTVTAREMKYEAERVADSVRGIKDVTNQLRVKTDTLARTGNTGMASRASHDEDGASHHDGSNGSDGGKKSRGTSISG